uniref:Uncharacterized protein n=1 Tax=Oryza glumipatula TaxID=40148 RepID=A0A0E0A277_9ORYZ
MIDCFVQNSDFMPWRRNVLRGHLLRESETRRRRQTPASRQSGSGGEVPYTMRTMKFDHSSNRNKPFCKSSRMT